MDIVCCTDKNFIMPCGIMLKSLCENNREVKVHIVIDESVNEDCKNSLKQIVESYHGNTLSFYLVDGSFFNNFPQLGYLPRISKATYYRLFLSEILPSDINKIIFLDCDLIVRHSLNEFWDTAINEYAIGCIIENEIDNVEHYNRLMYSYKYGYFNAGVLLINLKYWREHQLTKSFMHYIETYPQRIKYHDQDVLNGVLHNNKIFVSPTYNAQAGFFYIKERKKYSILKYGEEIESIIKDPCIVHFSTRFKPWLEDCSHPFKKEFLKYKEMTEWKNVPLEKKYYPRRSFKGILGDILRLLKIWSPIPKIESPQYFIQ